MFAAIYCRVSTAGQAENGTSLDSQRDACLRLAAVRGGAIWSVGAGTDVGGGTVLPGT
jgi:DNA invertase Pin-like site-specific DNA recombinase